MVTSDRISAFDHVLGTIPFKGELLNRVTLFWFEKTADLCANHVLDAPDPSVIVARACRPLPIEMVVRGYLTGSLWRDYQAGRGARAYGIDLPAGMRKDELFAAPILTPSTKAPKGEHDLPISPAEIVARGLVEQRLYDEAAERTLALFLRGQELARSRGLIMVDTKYEFGLDDAGKLTLIDEVHSPDSSRYWVASGYEARFTRGEDQEMLDKENVRQWLIRERGYMGDGPPPTLPDEVRVMLARRYADLVERITGERPPLQPGDVRARMERALRGKGYLA
jgi:phosphoribosylaminoimidazole-succinocarboxamide synthase